MVSFSSNLHLKISMYVLSFLGLWPIEFFEAPSKFFRRFYWFWANFMFFYNIGYVITQFIEMLFLIQARNLGRLMQNIGLSLLTFISIFRTTVVRGELSLKMINVIFDTEKRILASGNKDIQEIYMHHAKFSQFANLFFVIVGFLTSIPFYLEPYIEEKMHPELYQRNNETGEYDVQRLLPLSSWYPWDTNKHYIWTFVHQVGTAFVIEGFVVYTDSYMFSLMIFPVGQMKILQHIYENFGTYKERIRVDYGLDHEEAAKSTSRACILMHKGIIHYVDELDRALRFVMLLDFISCSAQMSVLLFQIIMFPFGILQMHAVEFLISMVIQMFLFYWNANEIIVESLNLAKSVWHNTWYEENAVVKKEFEIVLRRVQKPLTLSIGPFFPMSTETAISILKATYSYGMLLRQSYVRKELK